MRVHELAKKLNLDNKTLLAKLKRLGVEAKSHLSLLDGETSELVYEELKGKKKPAKKPAKKAVKKAGKRAPPLKKSEKKVVRPEPKEKAKKALPPLQEKVEPVIEKPEEKLKEKLPPIEKKAEVVLKEPPKPSLEFQDSPTLGELAKLLKIGPSELIKNLMSRKVMVTINQRLDKNLAVIVAKEFGVEAKAITIDEKDLLPIETIIDEEKEMKPRPPVVTIMGHVDHGKTTLLDAVRQSKIAEGEAGKITQHIGAYEVELDKGKVVFLDTPGHEAFTAMRAHGAKITDIVVLVVAGDDGVMPQTVEAIDHAKAAKVPIVVVINKMDKPNVDPTRVKKQLTEYDLVSEEWGGKTIFVPVSAKTGKGLDGLLEMLLLEAEMLELKANPNRPAEGTVIEAEIHKGKGPVATILVQKGTLRLSDIFICGAEFGKVKAMINDQGRRLKEAGPSTPVEILGFSNIPRVGETFTVVREEKKARQISLIRKDKEWEQSLKRVTHIHLEDLHKQIETGEIKELPLILKADVSGSVTAIKESLEKLGSGKVRIKIIHSGVGGINESDVILAIASEAIIFGFNIVPDVKAQVLAEKENVDIHIYRIIYELLDEVKLAMAGLLEPTFKPVFSGRAEVRQLFRVPKVGMVAGAYVLYGKISRSNRIRLIRDGAIIHEGSIASLRHFKEDVREVGTGLEFGIGIANFNDLKVGDLIEAFHLEKVTPKL